ncbi:sodium/calcium exchanger protein [Nitzschia inconspicua]|uniref:Sodium/calcium exchanger protein n=1 Tax=Nitzschia inconspicua TaxID=303405 RepID=A0A9K3L1L8_9STRA|nr:sodium/calcium exchanger protein [Nitzschia inconspicua]
MNSAVTMLRTTNKRDGKIGSSNRRFHTKVSFILTAATIILLAILSALFGSNYEHVSQGGNIANYDPLTKTNRWLEDTSNDEGDYSRFSCRYIYEQVPDAGTAQCQYARTCNGGDGVWASWVFCSPLGMNVWTLFLLLSPVMIVWMVTLFRLLGSTAEDFFSPSLEMFSLKLGLPPRFAGVTLLALGNGAADVSATISAIASDAANGYMLSLGALTGAAMLVGCVVSGIVVLVAEGVTCRGALVRDVMALAVTIAVVWINLSSGVITSRTIALFLSLYIFFVFVVLLADIYHRAVVLPRIAAAEAAVAAAEASALDGAAVGSGTTDLPNAFMRFVTAFSNYDNLCERDTTVTATTELPNACNNSESQEHCGPSQDSSMPTHGGLNISPLGMGASGTTTVDVPIRLHGQHGILHGDGLVPQSSVDSTPALMHTGSRNSPFNSTVEMENAGGGEYRLVEDHIDQLCVGDGSIGIPSHNWKGACEDCKQEIQSAIEALWEDIAFNGDLKAYEKFLLLCEFPFTLLRKASIPIPCEGYYNRGFVALSMVLSPLWFWFYMLGHEVNLLSKEMIYFFLTYMVVCIVIGATVLRFAPGGEGNMAMFAATPIALYGFVIAATWIDYIADHLVSLLDFMGIVLHIPGSIMGLTVLAWGNSMGDLSANMTMARKGLANMAMTACFAGPVFNILIGLGLGFSNLQAQTGKQETSVQLSAPIITGFVFVVINCVAILFVGMTLGKGRIEPCYGYIAVGLYAIYVVTSIALEI